MPIQFIFDSGNNIRYEKGVGEVTLQEFNDYREQLAETGLRSGLRCIADYRTAETRTYLKIKIRVPGRREMVKKRLKGLKISALLYVRRMTSDTASLVFIALLMKAHAIE